MPSSRPGPERSSETRAGCGCCPTPWPWTGELPESRQGVTRARSHHPRRPSPAAGKRVQPEVTKLGHGVLGCQNLTPWAS